MLFISEREGRVETHSSSTVFRVQAPTFVGTPTTVADRKAWQ